MSTKFNVANVSRLTRGMVIKQQQDFDKRREAFSQEKLQEMDEMVQLSISGTAGGQISWERMKIQFEGEMYDANAQQQRWSDLTAPTFTQGFTLESMEDNDDGMIAVCVEAVVLKWIERTGSVITGAEVAVGAYLPGYTGSGISFSGKINMLFSGYGTLSGQDNSPDLDIG